MTARTGAPRRPRIRRLEDRLLLSATPEAVVADLPDAQLINEDFAFGVTFDNVADAGAPDAAGYGPFVDLTVGPGATVTDAAYLDRSLVLQAVGTWDGARWVGPDGAALTAHPFDRTGAALELPQGTEIGQSWLLVALPFGSYGPEQPALDLRFSATLTEGAGAEPGEPVAVTARGGFRFGLDPLDNPRLDPPVQQAAPVTDTVTPVVALITKSVALPEGETAQGPNFPFDYVLTVDVANGVTVTDLRVTDALPRNLFFIGAASSAAPDAAVAPGLGAPQGLPGLDTVTEARFDYAAVTGAAGADVVIRLTAFAPRLDAAGAPLIDPLAPAAAFAENTARVEGFYEGEPVDGALSGPLESTATAIIRPFTVRKDVSVVGGGAPVPGSLLRFDLAIDVSDDQAFDALTLADLLDDGLELDAATPGLAPVLTLTQDGATRAATLRAAVNPGEESEFAAQILPAGDPEAFRQRVDFFLSQAARNLGLSGTFAGDLASDGVQQGPSALSLAYFARVTDAYRDPDRGPVVVNDRLANRVAGDALTPDGGPVEGDGSGAEVTLSPPRVVKAPYALNGVVGAPDSVAPGDLVTYRLTIVLDSLDARALAIQDFLPLPVFSVGADAGFATFTDEIGRLPAPGEILRGPADTLSGAGGRAGAPTVGVDAAANALRVAFADFSDPAQGGGTIDLLYTVRAADRPFADGLQLVNQAVFTAGDSLVEVAQTEIRVGEITLRQPVLTLTKGVVATDATGAPGAGVAFTPPEVGPAGLSFLFKQTPGQPGFAVTAPLTLADLAGRPVDSDLSGVDAGDTVKFALVIANAGGQDAFDLLIRDALPTVDLNGDGAPDPSAGFRLPSNPADLRLDVRFGDGTAIAFDGSAAPAPLTWSGDLFGAGIRIADAAGAGALAPDGPNDGRNIVVVTYELVAEDGFRPATTAVNTAEIAAFAAVEGGADFTEGVEGDFADDARVTGQGVAIAKRLVATSETFTQGGGPQANIPGGNGATIGERVTYQIEVRVPEGRTDVVINDLLPSGARLFVEPGFAGGDGAPVLLTTFTDAAGATRSFDGVVAQTPGGPALANGAALAFSLALGGRQLVLSLDGVAPSAGPGTGGDTTFAIRYTGIVTGQTLSGSPIHVAGDRPLNAATLDTATTAPTAPATAQFRVQEPALSLQKSFSPAVVEGGPGGATTMTLRVANATGAAASPAFGLLLSDPGLTRNLVSAIEATRLIGSTAALQGRIDAGGLRVAIAETAEAFLITATGEPEFFIAPGENVQLQFDLRVNPQAVAGDGLLNVATIPAGGYSSLPGAPQVERFYGPLSAQAALLAARPELFKEIVATSLGNDVDPNVAVGELVTYALRLDVPQGRTLGASLLDDLRAANSGALAGLLEIVSVDAVRVGAALALADRPGGLGVGDVVTADSDGDGRLDRLALDIGDILNDDAAPPGAGAESVVIEFTARVLNVAAAREGATHVNRASFESDLPGRPGAVTGQATASLRVIEPYLTVTKTSDAPAAGVDGGDAIAFTLRIDSDAARGSAAAWDVTLVDRLSAALELDPTSIVVAGGATAPGLRALTRDDVTAEQVGGVWVLTVGAAGGGDGVDLGPGGSASITYTARVRDAIREGDLVSNAAELTYRSLPFIDPADGGDPALPPGGDPAGAQRRDGSGVDFAAVDPANPPRDNPAIPNNYADLARVALTVRAPGPIEKTADRAVATIGERIAYTLVIPVIEGTTAAPTLVDDLAPGLGFALTGATVAESVIATDAAGAPIPILEARIEATGAGERLVLRLADIVTPGDGVGGDAIRISYAARPLNLDAVRDGDLLANAATFTSRPSDPAAAPLARADDAAVAVVEPALGLTKTVATAGTPDAGDVVTYTLTVTHTAASRSGAFELTLEDALPANLTAVGPVAATRDGVDVSALFVALGDRIVTAPDADLDLALGQTLTIVYAAALADRAGPAQTLTNAAALRWTSLDGAAEGERTGEGPAPPNDYRADAGAAFVTDDRLEVGKSVAGGGEAFAIGQPIAFFLDIDVMEGALRDLRVSDSLGAGLLLDPASLRVVANGFGGATPAIEGLTLGVDPATGAQTLSFTLDNTPSEAGSLLVNPGDNLRANDVIRVAYEARFANIAPLREGAARDNAVVVSAEDAGPDGDAATVRVVEPRVTVDKRVVSPSGPVDAGDIVLFEVALTGAGSVTAFDVTFSDLLPAPLTPTGALTAVDAAGAPVAGFSVVGGEIRGAGFDLAPGERVTLTYAARVGEAITPEALIENVARAAWTSQPGAAAGERDGSDGEGPDDAVLNNYAASDGAALTAGFAVALAKEIATTSQNDDADPAVAVGELITWRLTLGLTEGTTPGVTLTDVIARGMAPVGPVTVTPPAGLTLTFDDPNPAPFDPLTGLLTIALGDVALQGTPDGAPGPDLRAVVVTYQTRVLNVFDNQDGAVLPNLAQVSADGGRLTASAAAEARVVEPLLLLTKTNDAIGDLDAGDVVAFTVTLSHAPGSTADAWDVGLVDRVVPEELRIAALAGASIDGVDVSARFAFDATGLFLRPGEALDLRLGQTLTLRYAAVVQDDVGPRQSLENVVIATWTSLEGDVSPGAPDGERDGSLAFDVNDHIAVESSAVGTAGRLALGKIVDAPDALFAVGERIPYALDVTVAEGTLEDVVVADLVPDGLAIDLASLRIVEVGFAGAPVAILDVRLGPVGPDGARLLSFTLDNDPLTPGSQIVNPGDNDPDNDRFRIAFEALVANALSNRDGRGLANVAAVGARDVEAATDSAGATVVEPRIAAIKTVLSPPGPVDAGDPVAYEIALSNLGGAAAFDLTLVDEAPAQLRFVGPLTAVDAAGAPVAGFALSADGRRIEGAGVTIPVGGAVTLRYGAVVLDGARPGMALANTVAIAWSTLPGTSPDERDGTDGEGPDDAVLNNLAGSAGAAIEVGAFPITLSKTLAASALPGTVGDDAAVGEIVTYALRVGLAEGVTPGLRIEDALPQGLRYLAGSARVASGAPGGSTGFDPALVVYDVAVNRLIAPLGDVLNPGDNDPSNDFVILFYDAVVLDDPTAATQGATLVNVATAVTATGAQAVDAAALRVVEPTLVLTKSALTPVVGPGARADYAVTVAHGAGSLADAHDLIVADLFADGRLTLDPGSLTARILGGAAPVPVAIAPDGAGFRVALERLARGETLEILFSAAASALPRDNGATVANDATLIWDGVPGALEPDEQRVYAAGASAAVSIVGPDLRVDKTADAVLVRPGDAFVYTVVVQNKGAPGVDFGAAETATAVTLTDRLPEGVTLIAAAVDGAPAVPVFGPDGRTFTLDLGSLAAEAFRTVTLATRADAVAPAATGTLVNTARADMAAFDPTPEDNVDEARVGLIATPDLVVAKTNPFETLFGGQVTPFAITLQNVGDRVASGVVVADRVDAAVFEFVSASDGGVFDAASGAAVWTLDRLSPADGPVTLTLTLRVRPFLPAALTDTVNLVEAADDGRGGPDPTPEDNSARHADRLVYPDVVVAKSSAVEEVTPGDFVDFAITVGNVGAAPASGVVVVDRVDAAVYAFVSATDGGVFDPAAGTVTWRLGDIAPGAAPRALGLTLAARFGVDPAVETATNTVRADPDGATGLDADPSNNSAAVVDRLAPGLDVAEIEGLFGEDEEEDPEIETDAEPELAPLFTGRAPAGATVQVTLVGEGGAILAQSTTLVGESGGWSLSLPGAESGARALSAIVTTFPPPVRLQDAAPNAVFFGVAGDAPTTTARAYDLFDAREAESDRLRAERSEALQNPGRANARRYVEVDAVAGTGVNLI
jgi:fimbrial isopeptide formation D2 family protein/uncharacterized repeat protein (TIGR01451 family)